MTTPFIIGAYAALPESHVEQADFYRLLGEQPWVSGLEIPFGGANESDAGWLAEHVSPSFTTNVLTPIPGVMANMADDPNFGLASPDEAGRTAALEHLIDASELVRAFNDLVNRQFFTHILLHTAPTQIADVDSFKRSLETISQWNVDEAKIVIEHADAFVPGQKPEKGYLSLDDELDALEAVGDAKVGMTINWGRSAIEGRSTSLPLSHIQQAAQAGRLTGVMFSGAHATDNSYGPAWLDSHVPLTDDEPTSIMTSALVASSAAAAREAKVDYLGAKIAIRPSLSLEHRMAILRRVAAAAGVTH